MGKLTKAISYAAVFTLGYVMGTQNACDRSHREKLMDRAKELTHEMRSENSYQNSNIVAKVEALMSQYAGKQMNFYMQK